MIENSDDNESVSETRLQLIREQILKEPDENIRAIVVFGSVARGDATESSDLDYFLIKTRGRMLFRDETEGDLYRRLGSELPFAANPISPLIIEAELDERPYHVFDLQVLMYFGTPADLTKHDVQTYGYRDPQKSLVSDWVVIARTSEEQNQLTDLIKSRINAIKTRAKRPILNRIMSRFTRAGIH